MALRRYFGKISPLSINQLVGHNGELVIDEATDKVYIMDGVTPGGHEIANVQANLNLEYTNVVPAVNSIYNLGAQNFEWGNLYLTSYVNPSLGINNWGSLVINSSLINANNIFSQTSIETRGAINADSIFANSFIETNANNFSGYKFSGYSGATGLIHANIGNVITLSLTANGVTGWTNFANGFNTITGFTQFYNNLYVTGNNVTIPNFTTIGLLPSFNAANAKLTYVDNVNNYTQLMLQNKNSGSTASGDFVVTADNGTDSTHYIDLGINSSTFNDGGIDGPNDGYLLVEGGNLLVSTLTTNKDIIFATGGHTASNVVARFSATQANIGGVTRHWSFNDSGILNLPTYTGFDYYPSTGQLTNEYWVAAPGGQVNLMSNDGNNYVWVDDGGAYIATNWNVSGKQWTFGTNGILSLPSDNYIETTNTDLKLGSQGSVYIRSNAATGGGTYTWSLNNDGTTTFPDHKAVSITGNLTVGNLFVTGNSTVINTNSYTVSDNIIQLADQNPADILDLGFVAHRTVSATLQHTGLVRDASANTWRLFSNITTQPGTTIDFTNAVYDALQLGAISSPTITDLYSNAATQASNLGAIVGGTVTLANVKTTGGLYWANGVSALTSAYGNTQVSAYYVANTVATSNVQILLNGNIRLPTGATINESAGSGTITLSPNTTVNALAGVAIGGLGYLLSPNGTRNAVLNYNGVNGQMGVYILNTYGNQANAIVNGGSNNYGNIGGTTSYFGNAFVSNIYSPNYLYPNGTSILSGVSGTYGNTQVAAYLPTYTGTVMASYLTSPGGTDLTILPSTATGTRSYGHFVPQFSNTYNLGSGTLYWQNAWIGNITVSTGINWANGVSALGGGSSYGNTQVAAYLPTYSGISAASRSQVTTGIDFMYGGFPYMGWQLVGSDTLKLRVNIASSDYTNDVLAIDRQTRVISLYSTLNSNATANVGNVITTSGVFWANGVAYSSGGGGSGTPSGGNTMVQFNDGGAFGGATFLQYNKTSGNLVSNSTTTSISTTTGAVVISGGMGVGGNIYAGGDIFTNTGNLRSTSSIGNVFNFSATTVNIGNAATGIYMGSSTANVTVAGNVVAKNSLYTDNHLYANGVPYAGTYSNSNVASYLPTYTGNVGAGNLIGTSSNVTITSGANVWTFDNTGNLSLPNLSATYILAANTNGNINVNTIGTGAVNVSGNLTIGGINAGYAPNRPAFRVYGSNSYQWQGGNTIVAGSVDYNQGSYYNAITGIFTAPIAGLYHAYATLRVGSNNGMNQASIQKNSSNSGANVISFWETDTNTGTATHFSMTGYAKLVAGDTVRLQSITGNINLDANDSWGVTYIG